MVKWALLSIVTLFLALGTYLYVYLGAFNEPKIQQPADYGFKLIYKKHTGEYFKIAEVISEVESWARDNNIPCRKTIGIFLDDPKISNEKRLRSEGGCLVQKPVENLPNSYFYKELLPQKYISASFDGSPAIGPMVVYPEVFEWSQKQGFKIDGAILEVYTIQGKGVLTEYYFPLKK